MSGFYQQSVARQEAALYQMAAETLRQYDGSFTDVKLVKYRENAIFRVTRDDGQAFAFRIHRPFYHSEQDLNSELLWIDALSAHAVPVPEIIANKSGQLLTHASTDSVPEIRLVDMARWMDGVPLATLEENGQISGDQRLGHYRQLGALAANLHSHAVQWGKPAHFSRHDWHAASLVGDNPIWGRFWELEALSVEERKLIMRGREAGAQALRHFPLTPDNSSLIHADLIADNVIVSGDVLRPIDFDDCGFGWHMFEIATALYFTSDDPAHADLTRALLAGYEAVRPLSETDRNALPLFLMLRGTTYLGWVGSRSETATARELAPMLIDRCCQSIENYLSDTTSNVRYG